MLIVLDRPAVEEKISQVVRANQNQFKFAVTFLTGYNGIFIGTAKSNKLIFISVFEGPEINVITIPPDAYEMESMDKENKRIKMDEE